MVTAAFAYPGSLSPCEVAERRFLLPRTVSHHPRSIYNKLGVDNRAAAATFAIDHTACANGWTCETRWREARQMYAGSVGGG